MFRKTILYQSQQITQQLLDLVFPPHCAGCHGTGNIFCDSCQAAIQPFELTHCQRCGIKLDFSDICKNCQGPPLRLSGLRTMGIYQEPLRSCIHALKYDGNTRLASPLGELLARSWQGYGLKADLVIPVPLDSERQKQRGYNHAFLLAQAFVSHVPIPLKDDILIRHRVTPPQVGLSMNERHQNVAGAFLCTPTFATGKLSGRTILLIDDVCTTGATLEACAAPLFAAGAHEVWALVLARPV